MGFHSAARDESSETSHGRENLRSVLVVVIAVAGFVGLAFGSMMMLASPDGWVMKAASQAMTTAQQGTLASYDIADTQ